MAFLLPALVLATLLDRTGFAEPLLRWLFLPLARVRSQPLEASIPRWLSHRLACWGFVVAVMESLSVLGRGTLDPHAIATKFVVITVSISIVLLLTWALKRGGMETSRTLARAGAVVLILPLFGWFLPSPFDWLALLYGLYLAAGSVVAYRRTRTGAGEGDRPADLPSFIDALLGLFYATAVVQGVSLALHLILSAADFGDGRFRLGFPDAWLFAAALVAGTVILASGLRHLRGDWGSV